MSSFNEVIIQPVKRRLGFAVVIAVAALIAALVTGNSIVAAIVAIGVVVFLGLILESRRGKSSDGGLSPGRSAGRPYSVSYRWKTRQKPDLTDLRQVLSREGLVRNVESQKPNEVVLRGGSQLWTRLLGGYFVNPKRLPTRISLETQSVAGTDEFIVELGVRDRLGVGIRDEALGDRYVQAAAVIRNIIGGQLDVLGGHEVKAS